MTPPLDAQLTDALLTGLDLQGALTLASSASQYVREDPKRLGYAPLLAFVLWGLLRPSGAVRPSATTPRKMGSHPAQTDAPLRSVRVLSGLDAHRRGSRTGTVPCLADPHFALTSVGILHGPSGEGKSRFLSEVAYALLRGIDVFGWSTVQTALIWITEEPLSVWKDKGALILPPEELAWPWWRRLLRSWFPRCFPPTVWVISLPDIGYVPSIEAYRALVERVIRLARRTGAQFIIGDTVMALCPQAVSDNTLAKVFMMETHRLASRTGAAVELVHHDNDGGKPLGAKMLKGDADFTHHVTRLPHAKDTDRRRMVEFGKRYEPFPPPPLVYAMGDDGRLSVRGQTDATLPGDGRSARSRPGQPVDAPASGATPTSGAGATPDRPPLVLVPRRVGRDALCNEILGFLKTAPPPAPWTKPRLRDAIIAAKICNRGTAYGHLGHLLEDGLLVEDAGTLRLAAEAPGAPEKGVQAG